MTPEWTLQADLPERKQAELYQKLREARELHTDIHRLLRFTLLPKLTPLEKYNDAPERTHEELMALLDATIERIRNFSF